MHSCEKMLELSVLLKNINYILKTLRQTFLNTYIPPWCCLVGEVTFLIQGVSWDSSLSWDESRDLSLDLRLSLDLSYAPLAPWRLILLQSPLTTREEVLKRQTDIDIKQKPKANLFQCMMLEELWKALTITSIASISWFQKHSNPSVFLLKPQLSQKENGSEEQEPPSGSSKACNTALEKMLQIFRYLIVASLKRRIPCF